MSRRREQFASDLRHAVQTLFDRGLNDPRISGMLTVTEVHLTQDLKTAHVAVSILPADRQELTMHGLRSAAGHLRRQIGSGMKARSVPELIFRLDERAKKQAAILEAIAKAAASRPSGGAEPTPAGNAPGGDNEETRDAYAQDRPPEDRTS